MRRWLPALSLALLVVGSASPAQAHQAVIVPNGNGTFTSFSFITEALAAQQLGQVPPRDTQQPLPPGTATLRGRVYAADSGQPLRKAQVRLMSNGPTLPGQPPENRVSTTDVSGRYEFATVRAGRYSLLGQKGSYIPLQWGQQRPNEPGKPIDVLDGQTIEKLDFALPRGGVITGRVLDEFGEPIADVQVAAMRSQTVGGTRRLINAGRISSTNDIGEFRLFALPPGEYFVSATYRNQNPFAEQSDDRSGYAPTYYPGTADLAAAQKLPVAVGQTISDITLALLPIRTSRVTGIAVDSQNRPLPGLVQAAARSAALASGPFFFSPGQIRPDGSFTINGLTPGEYTLTAMPQGGPGAAVDPEYASVDITVDGADLSGVRLVGAKASTIAGRVIVGAGDTRSLRPSTIRIGANPMPTGGPVMCPCPQPVAVNDDWTFQAKARPGLTRLNIQPLVPPWSLRSIRYRGTDVTDTGLDVRSNEDLSDVEIEITDRTTDVSGSVTNGRGEIVKDFWVVLFSRDREKWKPPSRWIRVGRSDQQGRFQVRGLPPGDYLAMTDMAVDPSNATDPDFLERIQQRATRFTIGEGETKTLDLKIP